MRLVKHPISTAHAEPPRLSSIRQGHAFRGVSVNLDLESEPAKCFLQLSSAAGESLHKLFLPASVAHALQQSPHAVSVSTSYQRSAGATSEEPPDALTIDVHLPPNVSHVQSAAPQSAGDVADTTARLLRDVTASFANLHETRVRVEDATETTMPSDVEADAFALLDIAEAPAGLQVPELRAAKPQKPRLIVTPTIDTAGAVQSLRAAQLLIRRVHAAICLAVGAVLRHLWCAAQCTSIRACK